MWIELFGALGTRRADAINQMALRTDTTVLYHTVIDLKDMLFVSRHRDIAFTKDRRNKTTYTVHYVRELIHRGFLNEFYEFVFNCYKRLLHRLRLMTVAVVVGISHNCSFVSLAFDVV
jgi:hypothetical protein